MKPMTMEDVTERAAEFGGCMSQMKDEVRAKVETVQRDVTRNLRRAKEKTEDLLEEGRHEIKTHPLAAVATFAVAGMVVGFAAGMLFSRRR